MTDSIKQNSLQVPLNTDIDVEDVDESGDTPAQSPSKANLIQSWFADALSTANEEIKKPEAPTSKLGTVHAKMQRNSLSYNEVEFHAKQHPADTLHPALMTRWFSPLKAGSLRAASNALVASSLGTGIMSLPFAFSQVGIGLGLLTLTIAALGATLSLCVLMIAARYTETKSYAGLLELALNRKWAAMLTDATVLSLCMGAIACYVIFEGDFLPGVLHPLCAHFGLPDPTRNQSIIGVSLLVWPLALPAELSSLRYVTIASPIVLLFTTAAVLAEAPQRFSAAKEAGGTAEVWTFEPGAWLSSFSIMVAAFMNHQMAVAAGNDLDRPSIIRIVKTTTNATLVSWLIYAVIGIGGYLSWLNATQGNFILNYPQGSLMVWGCRLMLSLSLYFIIPVVTMPSAKSLSQLLLTCLNKESDSATPAMHAGCATFVLATGACIGLTGINVATMVGLLGGGCANLLMFWYPAVIFYKVLYPAQPRSIRCITLVILLICGIVSTVTLYINLSKAVR